MDQAALLDAYLGGPDRLRSAVTGLSREQMISRPVAGRWSVLEVVCHLVESSRSDASGDRLDVVPGQPPRRRRPELSRRLASSPA